MPAEFQVTYFLTIINLIWRRMWMERARGGGRGALSAVSEADLFRWNWGITCPISHRNVGVNDHAAVQNL